MYAESLRFPRLRRRQPLLRDQGLLHPAPARPLQGRHRLRRAARPDEDHDPGHGQRVHPEPDLRGRGAARRPGGVLPQRQPRGQVVSRDHRGADAEPSGLPAPRAPHRADERARRRPLAHVPDARQPARGAHARRSRTDARGDPLAERVDVRGMELQLRGSDLRDAGHHTADRREGDRGARMGPGAGGEDGPDPTCARPGLPRLPLVRVPRVRPVLAGRGRRGHPRVDALLRQRLHPLRQRLDRPERDAAVPTRLVPLHDRRSPADPGHHGRLRLPRRVRTLSRPPGRLHRGRRGMDSRASSSTSATPTRRCRTPSTGTRSSSSSGTST